MGQRGLGRRCFQRYFRPAAPRILLAEAHVDRQRMACPSRCSCGKACQRRRPKGKRRAQAHHAKGPFHLPPAWAGGPRDRRLCSRNPNQPSGNPCGRAPVWLRLGQCPLPMAPHVPGDGAAPWPSGRFACARWRINTFRSLSQPRPLPQTPTSALSGRKGSLSLKQAGLRACYP